MVSLQEKIKERIQGLTAELISDEELKQAIRESVEKLFFEQQKLKDGFYTKETPSVVDTLLKEMLKEQVRNEIAFWLGNNKAKVEEIVGKVIREGIAKVVFQVLDQQFSMSMNNLGQDILNKLTNR